MSGRLPTGKQEQPSHDGIVAAIPPASAGKSLYDVTRRLSSSAADICALAEWKGRLAVAHSTRGRSSVRHLSLGNRWPDQLGTVQRGAAGAARREPRGCPVHYVETWRRSAACQAGGGQQPCSARSLSGDLERDPRR